MDPDKRRYPQADLSPFYRFVIELYHLLRLNRDMKRAVTLFFSKSTSDIESHK